MYKRFFFFFLPCPPLLPYGKKLPTRAINFFFTLLLLLLFLKLPPCFSLNINIHNDQDDIQRSTHYVLSMLLLLLVGRWVGKVFHINECERPFECDIHEE